MFWPVVPRHPIDHSNGLSCSPGFVLSTSPPEHDCLWKSYTLPGSVVCTERGPPWPAFISLLPSHCLLVRARIPQWSLRAIASLFLQACLPHTFQPWDFDSHVAFTWLASALPPSFCLLRYSAKSASPGTLPSPEIGSDIFSWTCVSQIVVSTKSFHNGLTPCLFVFVSGIQLYLKLFMGRKKAIYTRDWGVSGLLLGGVRPRELDLIRPCWGERVPLTCVFPFLDLGFPQDTYNEWVT